jgi:hypothetical protein
MGTRKNEPQKLNSETNFKGAFQSYDRTPEEEDVANFEPDQALFNAGTAATFGKAKQDVVEGAGGYSGITNPLLAARSQQIALEELADQESTARADAATRFNQQKLQNKQFLASLRRPQYVQTGQSGFRQEFAPQSQSILASIIGGGSSIAGAF